MITEDKFLRVPITEEALNKLLDKYGSREKLNNFIADYAYEAVGLKRPKPPTPEQKQALEKIAQAEQLVSDGFMTADKLKEFKLQQVKEFDLDPSVVGVSVDEDKASTDKGKANTLQQQKTTQQNNKQTTQQKR